MSTFFSDYVKEGTYQLNKYGLCCWAHIIILNEFGNGKWYTFFILCLKFKSHSDFNIFFSLIKSIQSFNYSYTLGLNKYELISMQPHSLRAFQQYTKMCFNFHIVLNLDLIVVSVIKVLKIQW
jgi:hypothetical protein